MWLSWVRMHHQGAQILGATGSIGTGYSPTAALAQSSCTESTSPNLDSYKRFTARNWLFVSVWYGRSGSILTVHDFEMLTIAAVSHRTPIGRRRTIARAWHSATTLADLKEAQYSRAVVPVEGKGKILVQETDGEALRSVYTMSSIFQTVCRCAYPGTVGILRCHRLAFQAVPRLQTAHIRTAIKVTAVQTR